MLIFIAAIRRMIPSHDSIWLAEVKRVSIRANRSFTWQLDGDAVPEASELNTSIRPGALILVVPD
jgi:diacylglycerol kinase family enzyme